VRLLPRISGKAGEQCPQSVDGLGKGPLQSGSDLADIQEMMRKLLSPRAFWQSFRQAAVDFNNDNAFKLAASLSFSVIFAIGPLLIVVISLAGIFWGQQAVEGKLYLQIKDMVGNAAAIQIQDIIKYIQQSRHSVAGAVIAGAVLLIAATGVFTEIQGSINFIWALQAKPKKGWLYLLISRLISFSLIVAFGFISMVSLLLNSLMDLLSDYLARYFSHLTIYFFYAVNLLLILAVTVLLFMIIFRVLPDAIIGWRDAFIGAIFTALLFILGKLLIGIYLGHSNIGLMYGAAASMMVILLWVYYSSIILYFGAEFTKTHAMRTGGGIRPNDNAVFILKRESRELSKEQSDAI
jgi:membrane protein